MFLVQLKLMQRSMKVAESAASSAERSVEIMQDTAKRQLRAYLSVDRAAIDFPEPGVPRIAVVIKNCGQTPAHEVRHWIHHWILPYPLVEELPEAPDGFVMSSALIGAGGVSEMEFTRPDPIEPKHLLPQLGTAMGTIYVYGKVTYKDVFGQEQFMRYRFMFGGPEPVKAGKLAPCEEGNEAS
jgi:hypothetical protein